MCLHTVIWFQVFLPNTINLYTNIRFQVIIPLKKITNCLHTVIWFQVFLPYTINLLTNIWFQVIILI